MVLKTTFPNGKHVTEGYTELGADFSIVTKETAEPSEWERAVFVEFGDSHLSADCYAIIFYKGGKYSTPLYKGQRNELISDTGFLFKDLTDR